MAMRSSTLICIFLTTVTLASSPKLKLKGEERQAPNDAAFASAASALISSYIPDCIFSELSMSVSSAASAAGVTGDASSLIYSVLEATSVPGWFSSAIPSSYSSEIAALTSEVNYLRPSYFPATETSTATSATVGITAPVPFITTPGTGPTASSSVSPSQGTENAQLTAATATVGGSSVVVQTTTDSAGHTTFTTSFTNGVSVSGKETAESGRGTGSSASGTSTNAATRAVAGPSGGPTAAAVLAAVVALVGLMTAF